MIEVGLGEREGFPHVACIALAQAIIPPLHMIGLPTAFAHTSMGLDRKDFAIALPEVTKAPTPFVGGRNPAPQAPTRLGAMLAQSKGHNLPGAATQHGPQLALLGLLPHKTPDLIDLQLIPG